MGKDHRKRFLEIFNRVNNVVLNESILDVNERNKIISEFIKFVKDRINLPNTPNINISYDETDAQRMKSFGLYSGDEILVVAANRNLADILRTIVHELVHHKQWIDGRIDGNSSATGSEIENEANAIAGILMREYAKINPIIFE